MTERNPQQAIIRRISNPETKGSLTVMYKKDMIAETVGRVLALPLNTMVGMPEDALKQIPPEMVDQIIERWKDVPWKGDVLVRIGHVDPHADWKRLEQRLKDEGKLSPNASIRAADKFGIYLAAAKARFTRGSFFDPYTRTIHVMRPKLATAMHELGHAEDILGAAPVKGFMRRIKREHRASYNAMKHYKNDDERRVAMHALEPMYGTYIGGALQILGSFLGLKVWSDRITIATINTSKGQLRFGGRIPYAYLGAVALAHLYSRLPWRRQSFGYVFEGKTAPEPLKPHQVLVATARPGR